MSCAAPRNRCWRATRSSDQRGATKEQISSRQWDARCLVPGLAIACALRRFCSRSPEIVGLCEAMAHQGNGRNAFNVDGVDPPCLTTRTPLTAGTRSYRRILVTEGVRRQRLELAI